ncbi:MAG: hypothetical protein KJO28_14430 [Desulfofustis sp.]|nr:hypothetical protein [Desulfofustis sp.]NNF46586.1 hypothetical protein [Desulfofustis sp.]NNK58814.1 hypothetical protein [Desulfofustis sp.]
MNLFEEGYLLLAKPRIVHSLPGRLRLQVPLLKKVGRDHQHWNDLLCTLLKVPEGIEEVSANSVSGTVLFNYNTKMVSEKEILSFITSLSRVFVTQRDDLGRLLKNDSDTIFNCLREWLQRTVTQRLHLDVTQRILSDDFH